MKILKMKYCADCTCEQFSCSCVSPAHLSPLQMDHGDWSLPLWFSLHSVGMKAVRERIRVALHLSGVMWELLLDVSGIEILSPEPSMDVLFRYVPTDDGDDVRFGITDDLFILMVQELQDISFITTINKQLMSDLGHTFEEGRDLHLRMYPVTQEDGFICFSPLLSPMCTLSSAFLVFVTRAVAGVSGSDLHMFVDNLVVAIELMESTFRSRGLFKMCMRDHEIDGRLSTFYLHCLTSLGLTLAHLEQFVGLGAVRYIPQLLPSGGLSVLLEREVDTFNLRIVKLLQEAVYGQLFQVPWFNGCGMH